MICDQITRFRFEIGSRLRKICMGPDFNANRIMQTRLASLLIAVLIVSHSPSTGSSQAFQKRYGNSTTRNNAGSQQPQRSIELRVLVDDRSAIGSRHQWMQALAEVGADRVVAETSRKTEPSFEEFGSGSSKTLSIVGIVKQGKLHLPGGKFSIRQTGAITDHLKKLRDDGAEVTVAEKLAFGLTAKQLISVHDQLGVPIESSTSGVKAADLAKTLLKESGYSLLIDEATKLIISQSESAIEDELEGYSIGLGLALALRQMGLVFEPTRPPGENVQLLIREVDEETKHWPVGWPISESRKKVAPSLFVKVPVQAFDTPLIDLLNAIESRSKLAFLYDNAKISQKEIDMQTKVTFSRPGKKVSFDIVIDKVLTQAKPKLKSEIKIDEVGKPFLWITPR